MKIIKFVLIIVLLCLMQNEAFPQTIKWEYLINNNLPPKSDIARFDDIYFTDYLTGTAVDLNGNVFKTKDGGENWYQTIDLLKSAFRSVEFLNNGKTGIIGSLGGRPMRSEDGGETWINISSKITDTSTIDKFQKAICGLSHFNNNFYGVGWYGAKIARFYKSTDKGLSWETTYIDTNLATGLVDVVFISEDTGFVSGTKSAASKAQACVVLKTTDGGKSWTRVFYDETIGGVIWKLQKIDKDNFVGSIQPLDDQSVAMIKSEDGGNSWHIVNSGLKSTKGSWGTQGIGFVTPLKGWLGGWYSGIYETNDGGKTWDTLNFGVNLNRFFIFDSTHAYACGQSVYRYGDDFKVGIRNENLKSEAPHKIYPISPNPSSGKVKIEFDLGTKTIAILQVIKIDSRQSWEVHREILSPGHYTYYWDDPNAPSGNYIILLDNNEIRVSEKFTLVK